MAFPTAAGTPQRSGIDIPTLFASAYLVAFYATSMYSEIANTNYEGMISAQGDKVTIAELPDISIADHAANDIVQPEHLTPTSQDLLIDKGKRYAFTVDAVHAKQSHIDFASAWGTHAGKKLREAIDQNFLQTIYASAAAENAGTTAGAQSSAYDLGGVATNDPHVVTSANAAEFLANCASVLSEQNVPSDDRWIVVPVWLASRIKTSDLANVMTTGDTKGMSRTNSIGSLFGMKIFESNNLAYDAGDSAHSCVFGWKGGVTFATQLVENEVITNPWGFGKLVRGLHVYGFKVTHPEAVGHAYVAAA